MNIPEYAKAQHTCDHSYDFRYVTTSISNVGGSWLSMCGLCGQMMGMAKSKVEAMHINNLSENDLAWKAYKMWEKGTPMHEACSAYSADPDKVFALYRHHHPVRAKWVIYKVTFAIVAVKLIRRMDRAVWKIANAGRRSRRDGE